MRKLLAPVVTCVLLLGLAGQTHACPGCKDTVAEGSIDGGPGGPTPGLPSGFNTSIYVMLVGLFCVLGLVAGIVVKGVNSSDRTPPPPGGFPLS